MLSKTRIFLIIGGVKQGSPLAFWTFSAQASEVFFGMCKVISPCIKQVKVIESLVNVRKVWIVLDESKQCFLTEIKVI